MKGSMYAEKFTEDKGPLKISRRFGFEKIGVDEIEGLKSVLLKVMTPLTEHLKQSIYWNDLKPDWSEYKGRDGFIPHSDNHGGPELTIIIPKCESYEFGFLEFGECDECAGETQCGYNGQECSSESEGHCDAKLRFWLKFEGLNDQNEMEFWLYCGGGNGDAPYFRTKYESDIFETSFSAKTLKQVETRGVKAIKALIKVIK